MSYNFFTQQRHCVPSSDFTQLPTSHLCSPQIIPLHELKLSVSQPCQTNLLAIINHVISTLHLCCTCTLHMFQYLSSFLSLVFSAALGHVPVQSRQNPVVLITQFPSPNGTTGPQESRFQPKPQLWDSQRRSYVY